MTNHPTEPLSPAELESRARELEPDSPTEAARLYQQLAEQQATLRAETAARYYFSAAALYERVDAIEQARTMAREALYHDGLSGLALHKATLDKLRRLCQVGETNETGLRLLYSIYAETAKRLAEAGSRRAASKLRFQAAILEHRLVHFESGIGRFRKGVRSFFLAMWRMVAGYGERPLRLIITAVAVVYLFGLFFILVNYDAVTAGYYPPIDSSRLYSLFDYFGISTAAFFGDGFAFALAPVGWLLIGLEAALGWLITLAMVVVLFRRLK